MDSADWNAWSTRAGSSVWLFGSRAANCASLESDTDILVLSAAVQERTRVVQAGLDVVYVPWGDRAARSAWLSSELAAHIVRYGRLIVGAYDWLDEVNTSQAALGKLRRTLARFSALERAWFDLNEEHRSRRTKLLRRDLQRVIALQETRTVPPTRLLDDAWGGWTIAERERLVSRFDVAGCSEVVTAMLGPTVAEAGRLALSRH